MIKNANNNLIKKGDTLVVSVSGGLDSMVLLDYLFQQRKEKELSLHVAHIDHKKRDNSHKDANFVKKICMAYEIPFYLYEIDDEDYDNFHHFAHKKRYDFLYDVAKQVKAKKIVLAHHQDDLAETILMRLVRGSSFEGYRGILASTFYKDMKIIRPFLDVTKASLKHYQESMKIKYKEDESNQEDLYTRNRFRHHIMPLLEKENPKYLDKFSQFSDYQNKAYQFIDHHAQNYFKKLIVSKDSISFKIESFKQEFDIVQVEIIKLIINHITDNKLELTYQNILDIIELIYKKKPHMTYQHGENLFIYKKYDIISIQNQEEILDDYEYSINDFGNYRINNQFVINLSKKPVKNYDYIYKLCYNSLDLVFPITIRNRRPGDRLNIKIGSKKLKDFFIDKKTPLKDRNQLPLIINNNSEIMFIPDLFQLNTSGDYSIYIQIKKTKA